MRAGATLSLAAMLMIGASASLQTAVAEGDTRSLTYVWRKTSAGSSYIVLHKKNAAWLTPAVNDRIELDYDASEPSFLGRNLP